MSDLIQLYATANIRIAELERENAALRQDGICRRRGIPTKEESKRIKDRDEHIERLWKENAALKAALDAQMKYQKELRTDRDRLDYLERNDNQLRATIDAAMKVKQ